MTGPARDAAGQPHDAQPVETPEYWIGYYNGKAAAMQNLGVVYRTHLDLAGRAERRGIRMWYSFYLFAALSTAGFIGQLVIGSPPWWSYMMQGSIFGMILADLAYRAGRR